MAQVSMTWPEYLGWCCRVDGRLVYLGGPRPTEALLGLLLRPPHRAMTTTQMIEFIYENPDDEPDWAVNVVSVVICRLRRRGIDIRCEYQRGYWIPAESRGCDPPPVQIAA